jgi:hypothetical protein
MGGWQLGGYATASVTPPAAVDPFGGDTRGIELDLARWLPPPTFTDDGEIK